MLVHETNKKVDPDRTAIITFKWDVDMYFLETMKLIVI